MLSTPTVLNLNNSWTTAEFNVFGYNLGSNAQFNDNVVMVVQTSTNTTPVTTAAPSFLLQSETGETNSLSLTSNSICPIGGSQPGVQFMQSNNGAGAQPCPLAPSQVQLPVAFQANTHFLWIDQNNNGISQIFGMKPGTVPSLITIPGGIATGFQADTGNFWLDQNGGGTDSGKAMQGTSNPSVARNLSGQITAAFQGSNGNLWFGSNGAYFDTGFAMKPNTSPSVAINSGGDWAVAFQGSNGHAWIDVDGSATDFGAMQGTSSPSVTSFDNPGHFWMAFQGANGDLFIAPNAPFGIAADMHLGMMANTSPSATTLSDNSQAVAFQANTGSLWYWHNGGRDERLGMYSTASPIISALPDNGYQIAFKANTSNLWIDLNGYGMDQNLGMN